MKVVIDIPNDFTGDYIVDKFKDFFSRVIADIDCNGMCGRYEKEIAEMFLKAFDDSEEKIFCNCQHNSNSRDNEPCCRCDSRKTNADRIRNLSDEEMADRMTATAKCDECFVIKKHESYCLSTSACRQKHLNYDLTYVWGMDNSEQRRADELIKSFPEFKHEFPLIDLKLSKQDCHAIADRLSLKRPVMYDLGYSNNNCVGCVKGGMGYWNKIRKDFPEVFENRAKLEREIGHSCLNGVFLDELDPNRGKMEDEISTDCGIMCYLNLKE